MQDHKNKTKLFNKYRRQYRADNIRRIPRQLSAFYRSIRIDWQIIVLSLALGVLCFAVAYFQL